jgi:hypothetical protein
MEEAEAAVMDFRGKEGQEDLEEEEMVEEMDLVYQLHQDPSNTGGGGGGGYYRRWLRYSNHQIPRCPQLQPEVQSPQ